MAQCKHCDDEMSPSKKGVKKFCSTKCSTSHWYAANKQTTIDRAAHWRANNPDKMAVCRLNWRQKNPTYHSTYTMSWRGDGETSRMAIEAIQMATNLSAEERIELAHTILDLKLGMATPAVVEEFLVEIFDE